ncbi:MAG: rubredoxin [Methanoculleaceae archaeon]
MDRYRSSICGHVYDPEKGEPKQDIPAGTPFEDLSDDWRCPVCLATEGRFKPMG